MIKAVKRLDEKVGTLAIIVFFQLVEDAASDFANCHYVRTSMKWEAAMLQEEVGKFRRDIKREFDARGASAEFEAMREDMAGFADEVERHVNIVRNDVRTKLVRFIPFDQVEAFTHVTMCGMLAECANQVFRLVSGAEHKRLKSIVDVADVNANRFTVWGDVSGQCDGELVNSLVREVARIVELTD